MTWDRPLRAACKRTAGSSVHHRWRRRFRRRRTQLTSRKRHDHHDQPHDQSQQSTVGEGRLHPDRRHHALERRGSRATHRRRPRPRSARPRLRRRHDRHPGRPGRRERARRRYRRKPRRRWPGPRRTARAHQLHVRGGRRLEPRRDQRRLLRPRRHRLRCHVRPAAVRHCRRDGARGQARRPNRDGQLDPRRPHARRADPADQRVLLAPAARRLHQPRHLGRRGTHPRTFQRRRRRQRPHRVRTRHVRLRLRRNPEGIRRSVPPVLRTHHERLRRRRVQREGNRTAI